MLFSVQRTCNMLDVELCFCVCVCVCEYCVNCLSFAFVVNRTAVASVVFYLIKILYKNGFLRMVIHTHIYLNNNLW